MDFYTLGAREATEKYAFGPEAASKVLQLAKQRQLPKASARIQPNLSAIRAPSQLKQDAGMLAKGFSSATSSVPVSALRGEALTGMQQNPLYPISAQRGTPSIFPGKGSMESQMGLPQVKIPSSQQKMLHAITKGHELDETMVKGRLAAVPYGHASPDVLYREHNRLVTMPDGNEQVKDLMQKARAHTGDLSLFPKGITYGEGSRLSRHARKRLTELADVKAVNEIKEQFKPKPRSAYT